MSALAAVRSPGDPHERMALLETMLRSSPHRGSRTAAVHRDGYSLGITFDGSYRQAFLFDSPEIAAALSGSLDAVGELPLQPNDDPAETLARAFLERGPDIFSELRGAFSGVIGVGSDLLFFRDQIGFRALFYREEGNRLLIASEPKQLIAASTRAPEPDLETIERIFYWDLFDPEPCAIKGVHRLPAASVGLSQPGRLQISRYWDPSDLVGTARLDDNEIKERFDELMAQAVKRCLKGSDVVSLSGGIDSPAVASFAVSVAPGGVAALSEVFPDLPSVDESRYIDLTCNDLGLTKNTFRPRPRRFSDLDAWARLLDGPIPSWHPADDDEYLERATALGYTNVLTGEFAESVTDLSRWIEGHLFFGRRFGLLSDRFQAYRRNGASGVGVAKGFVSSVAPRRLLVSYHLRSDRFLGGQIPGWLDGKRVKAVIPRYIGPARTRWRDAQLEEFGSGPGLTLEGKEILESSRRVSVRRPFADVDLWEFFLALPAEAKFPEPGRKSLLKKLLRGRVSDQILDRPKKTFFNDYAMTDIDIQGLRKWLVAPNHPIAGVDYELLERRLSAGDMSFTEYSRALDLARIHAFLSLW